MSVSELRPAEPPEGDFTDNVIDELLPQTDWQRLVRGYPVTSLLVAFAGGVYLGYRRGATLVTAVGGLAAKEVTRRVDEFLGG
jgi:hypothetical protein